MSPGHVFHPGHDAWHGQTVVVYTKGPRTLVGRWDAVEGGLLRMMDVALHETVAPGGGGPGGEAGEGEGGGEAPESREAWIARLKQYGIPVAHKMLTLPEGEVDRIVRLRDA